MKFNDGYRGIQVKIIDFPSGNLNKAYEFGRFGREIANIDSEFGTREDKEAFFEELVNNEAFPKWFTEQRISFEIRGISRICLAQITRDRAFFCSESGGGVRPLSQEFNIPLSIYNDVSLMNKIRDAEQLLQDAYIEALEKDIPYLDARYIGLHCQTISVCGSYSIGEFARTCHMRTNSSFCDETNYVYRRMWWEIQERIRTLGDYDQLLYNKFLSMDKCIDDQHLETMHLYNSDFQYKDPNRLNYKIPATNDWRKSAQKLELERMYIEEPYLLTNKEKYEINRWMVEEAAGEELDTTFDPTYYKAGRNLIKRMPYYEE